MIGHITIEPIDQGSPVNFQFKKPARPVSRVFLHCSASDKADHDSAAVIEGWHKERGWAGIGYHYFIRKDGTVERGRDLEKIPAAQEGHNTGTIAICLHGLSKEKFTEAQFAALRALCGQINRAYAGRVTFHGHCEVARKSCPVFDYRQVLRLNDKGAMQVTSEDQSAVTIAMAPSNPNATATKSQMAVLQNGSKGNLVLDLQKALTRLKYFTGALDGDFGPLTRAAVLAFQADNHLETDGRVGPITRDTLASAAPRPVAPMRAFASFSDLVTTGSQIARASRNNFAVGAVLGGGGLATVIDAVNDQADVVRGLFEQHGLTAGLVILAAGAFVAWQSWRAGQARLADYRSGKTA
ncbi:MAG: hypothetical protein DI498_10905 [Paracoccus denitrificans]|nr:MAG: hypothetical protein DI498_10905 [Paracoccus denitrificans]PZO83650.1 MAG: hypothetical protein DI633_10905 [Paracoccus denitrificans]